MIFARARRAGPVALDVDLHVVRAAQARGDARSARTAAFPRAERGAWLSPEEARRLAPALARRGFAGARVALAPPEAALLTAALELPPRASGAPIEQLAAAELGRVHRRDPAVLEWRSWDIPPSLRAPEQTHLMCAGVERAASEEFLAALDAGGLEPVALEPRAWALRRGALALRPAASPPPGPFAVVEVAWAHALVVVADERAVLYQRALTDAGLGTVRGALAASSGDEEAVDLAIARVGMNDPTPEDEALPAPRAALTSFAESLGGELRASLAYAQHRFGVSAGAIFAGAGAEAPGLCEALAQRAGVPGVVCECPGGPAMLAALGLALHDPEDEP